MQSVSSTSVNAEHVTDHVTVVVPLLNERESLAVLLGEIEGVSKSGGFDCDVVFVDDGSTDGSWDVVLGLTKESRPGGVKVSGLRFRRNFGKAAALAAGFQAATGRIVMTMDADLQDDPAEMPRFLEAIASGLDLVSGYKQVRHDPWHKVFPSRVFNWMVSWVTGVRLHDHNCGFKAYRAEVTRELRLYGELHRYTPVLAASAGFRVGELVVAHRPRKYGKSKFGWTRFAKGFLDLLQVRFITRYGRRPMHFFGTIALLSHGFAGLITLLLLLNWLVRSAIDPHAGIGSFTQLLMFIGAAGVAIFGGQSLLIGFVAELLAKRDRAEPFVVAERAETES